MKLENYKIPILYDSNGAYIPCEGKRKDKSRRNKLRKCGMPSVTNCFNCGYPICPTCEKKKRHKCKGVS